MISDDFHDHDTPVTTVIHSSGTRTLISFRIMFTRSIDLDKVFWFCCYGIFAGDIFDRRGSLLSVSELQEIMIWS